MGASEQEFACKVLRTLHKKDPADMTDEERLDAIMDLLARAKARREAEDPMMLRNYVLTPEDEWRFQQIQELSDKVAQRRAARLKGD